MTSGTLFPETLETDRLLFERLCHETIDAREYYEYCPAHNSTIEEVTAYLPWDPHETPHETASYIDTLEEKWEEGMRAEYLLRPKPGEEGTGTIAGSVSLLVDWETQTAKPGIWLRKPFWGRGYAGERAGVLIELAFEQLDLELVAVPVQDGNERSRRAVEKYTDEFGGQYDGVIRNATVRPDGTIIDHHRYTIISEQYQQSTANEE